MKQLLVLLILSTSVFAQFPSDSILEGNQTPTYEELIDFYQQLSGENEGITLYRMGESDYGVPIYLCILNAKGDSSRQFEVARKSTTVLINNGIHPGEPCGINASMQVALDYSKMSQAARDDYPVVAIVPAYNVGGMYNRGAYSRANQKGPQHHGFRGNAQHLDLNRDFIKMDSENMFTFAKIFHGLDPDIFIDTHTSNGADYQYTLTYITPILEKLAPSLKEVYEQSILPHLHKELPKKWDYEPFRYVNLKGRTPGDGLTKFNATPRYSMGYADLFHTISFTTETHMLKAFEERVRSTYAFILEIIGFATSQGELVEEARRKAFSYDALQDYFPSNFVLDSIPDSLSFKGYEWRNEKSAFADADRLLYDKAQPFERKIPWFHKMHPTDSLVVPKFYIVGRQEKEVIERLASNGIEMTSVDKDAILDVEVDYMKEWQTTSSPYEGHFLHYEIVKRTVRNKVAFKKGDVMIRVQPRNKRFLAHVLSPEYRDSYFAWNFFDSYLQQKEHFSPYVFEELAVEYLNQNDTLRERFEKKVANDEDFASNRRAQLQYIYENSPYHEREHLRIPVFRILPD
ncbi:MAG: hypothetical protein ACQERC_02665 [Bacteroidota bacterium]